MTATIWSKFFWNDWFSDAKLQRCSLTAQGLWIKLLCVAAQHEPMGYLCVNGESLTLSDIARIAGVRDVRARSLMADLERNGVFSRDRHGRIYSRRMVRDAKAMLLSKQTGKLGGRISRDKQRGIFDPSKGGLAPRSQSPESISQVSSGRLAPLLRACQVMGIEVEALRLKPAWMMFGDFFAELLRLGCDAERDIWPTIARVASRGVVPSSPLYFKTAILEARDARGGGVAVAAGVSPQVLAERMEAFARDGVWSSKWGERPGEEREVRSET
ncbi:MAG: hypothetical protein ABL996_18300 [Micropepsaceae bacterium]